MLLEHLGSLVAFKAKNILMKYQQIVHMDCRSWPQRHLDANLRRKVLADCVIGKLPSQPQAVEKPRGEDLEVGGKRDSGSQESQPCHISKNRIAFSWLCICQPAVCSQPLKGSTG